MRAEVDKEFNIYMYVFSKNKIVKLDNIIISLLSYWNIMIKRNIYKIKPYFSNVSKCL